MHVTTVLEALALEDAMPITCFGGLVDAVFPYTQGENETGPWTIQNIMIKDGASSIKVSVKGQDEIPKTTKGKKIYFSSVNGTHGWTGVKSKLDTFKGKTQKIVNVSKTAIIAYGAPAAQDEGVPTQAERDELPAEAAPTPAPAKAAPAPAPAPARQQRPAPAPAAPTDFAAEKTAAVKAYLVHCGKLLNATKLCFKTAEKAMAAYMEMYGEPMESGQFQSLMGIYLIDSAKHGLIDGLPSGDMDKYMPEKKPVVMDKAA